jgi:YesN/AraC family two-component response regulator
MEELNAELKLLHWHKLANEAALKVWKFMKVLHHSMPGFLYDGVNSRLKAALIRTKSLRSADVKAPREKSSLQEKASWMAQVIEEEQRKPLQVRYCSQPMSLSEHQFTLHQVSKEFVSVYSAKEAEENERLDSEVQRHIDVLKRLREKISVRDESR